MLALLWQTIEKRITSAEKGGMLAWLCYEEEEGCLRVLGGPAGHSI